VNRNAAECLILSLAAPGFPEELDEALDMMFTDDVRWQRLSHGEKAIVKIAASLVGPHLVSLHDEFAHLDVHHRAQAVEAIRATALGGHS
jgi:ABC-type molybdenum transport system ATPase subunit/photorepair protein PhrA